MLELKLVKVLVKGVPDISVAKYKLMQLNHLHIANNTALN